MYTRPYSFRFSVYSSVTHINHIKNCLLQPYNKMYLIEIWLQFVSNLLMNKK